MADPTETQNAVEPADYEKFAKYITDVLRYAVAQRIDNPEIPSRSFGRTQAGQEMPDRQWAWPLLRRDGNDSRGFGPLMDFDEWRTMGRPLSAESYRPSPDQIDLLREFGPDRRLPWGTGAPMGEQLGKLKELEDARRKAIERAVPDEPKRRE